jgi:hypothetical protein
MQTPRSAVYLPQAPASVTGQALGTGTPPRINEKQLRALSRRHLLMMIYDLQEELIQIRGEKEAMLQAYQAGRAQNLQGT